MYTRVYNMVALNTANVFPYQTNFLTCTLSCRRLQSCVDTRARLGYTALDAQLQKAYFVTTLYAIRTSVHSHAICW